MRVIYNNLIDDNTITALTEAADYPASNLQEIHLTSVWRTTALTAQTLVVNAGTGNVMSANCIVIAAHNLSGSASISIQANTADTWATPAASAAVTQRDGTIVYYFTEDWSYQYYRYLLDDQTNTDDYIKIGRISLAEYMEFDPGSLSEFVIKNIRTDRVADTVMNQMYSDKGVGYREFEYRFPKTSFINFDKVRTLWSTVGMWKPFFFMNFSTRFTEIEPAYVRLDGDLTERISDHLKWEYSLTMRETG